MPGQPLAHHEGDRVLDRRVRPVGDVLVLAAAVVAVLEHGREIAGDARHAPRADRLDPRLLDGVEHRAGGLRLRGEPAMDAGVVAGEPQRHRIGVAADTETSCGLSLRGGSGRRALSPIRTGGRRRR